MIEQCRNVIYHVSGSGITTEQQKKTWLINWYFANDPMGSIYLATLRNPSLVASYQTSPGMLYGANGAAGMETYFIKIKTHFGQSMFDQLVTEFAQQSNLYVDEIKVDEWHLYGCSDALHGVDIKRVARDLNLDNQITSNEYVIETPEEVTYLFSSYQLERGAKRYELSNHLGNVLTVISDKKTAVFTGTSFNYFAAERISATDYSPFGAPLASRSWNGGEYRFGFNTQERDDEIAGVGNIMTAQFWEYDTRLGRRWNVDQIVKIFESPYSTFSNNPIWLIDKNGNDTSFMDETARKDFLETYSSVKESIAYNQNEIEKNNKKALKRNWSSETLSEKNSAFKSRIDALSAIVNMMDEIMKPTTPKIIYSTNDNQLKGKDINGLTWQSQDNEVTIVYPAGNQGCLIHESRHGFGYIQKEWNSKSGYDYNDELEAYNMQMIWDKAAVIQKIEEMARFVYPDNINKQSSFNLNDLIIEKYKDDQNIIKEFKQYPAK